MIKARKEHQCENCKRKIIKGERYNKLENIFNEDGKFEPIVFKFCRHCTRIWTKQCDKENKTQAIIQSKCAHDWQISECFNFDYCSICAKVKKHVPKVASKKDWQKLMAVMSVEKLSKKDE